ncbi:unnamed protein product [Mytilus edulis]|uniref:Uncharacterized protein n=1 Tax=Mytilus edulis TaxID=6550 RepID=A0A8S3QKC8_MYTED|nr:unnamed protein product [Mytilus edulis]
MGLIPWRLRKYTFQKGNKPYNKGKKYRNKTLPAEKGKFVRLPKDLYDLVTKSVHNKNVQLIPASTKSARFLRPKPPTKTEVEKCAENETKTGNKTLPAEKGKFVRLPKDLSDLVTKSVHNKNVQLIPASTKSPRFLRPKPPTKTEVEKCAENETKTG